MAGQQSTQTARAQHMRAVLRQWERSGLTRKACAQREAIAVSTLTWWRHVWGQSQERVVRREPTGAAFREVTVPPAAGAAPASIEGRLRSGHVLRVAAGVDAAVLRTVVEVLEGRC